MMATHSQGFHSARWRSVIVALLVSWSMACSGDCAGVGSPAFSIDVLDDASGQPAATGATVYVFRRPDFALVDAVVGVNPLSILAAWDQDGRFDVLLEKTGYWPWTQNNVLVETHSSCTTKTVNLTARLRLRST